eukprot:TRINITY_DN6078_c0_g2_i1.p2 TRINITY_DN6078_c0_g2~~TRINITY_DN6078_c0_g2_i1.p2  ORF type:complete len:242 (+),score=-2.30 TRINITY_DN6078_c0_g2_i1:209-934(+)
MVSQWSYSTSKMNMLDQHLFILPLLAKINKSQNQARHLSQYCQNQEQSREYTMTRSKQSSFKKLLTTQICECKQVDELLEILYQHSYTFDNIHIKAMTHAIGQYLHDGTNQQNKIQRTKIRKALEQLFEVIQTKADELDSQALASCMWIIGKVVDIYAYSMFSQATLDAIFNRLCDNLGYQASLMNTQSIAICLWAMGKIQWDQQYDVQVLIQAAKLQNDHNAQDISNTLWAMANTNSSFR